MPTGDIYECTYDATYDLNPFATVFHFVQIGADGAGDARDSVNLMFEDELASPYLEGLSDKVVSLGCRTRRLHTGQTQALSRSFFDAGTVPGDGLPPNQVGVLRTYGVLSGRRGIGRIMVPGIPQEDVNQGRINVDQITFRNVLAAALELDQDDGSTSYLWHACVYSRIDGVARQINNAGMLTQIKNLRSRTITG